MNRPTVLILSTNPVFARQVSTYWPADSNSPEFTVLEKGLFRDLTGRYGLAIADASDPESYAELKHTLLAAGKPAILIHADSALALTRTEGTLVELRGQDGLWPLITGLLGREILQRTFADAGQRQAEAMCAAAQAEVTLGRYIVEMRHNINNALTTVLGNSELLMLEPGLPAAALAQADTLRNMALRLHEIFQRFSSLEKELSVVARESEKRARAAGAGN